MNRSAPGCVQIAMIFIAVCGCAQGSGGFWAMKGRPTAGEEMTQERMELLFADQVGAIMGPRGAVETRVDGVTVYLISDPASDRMRIIAPIADAENPNPRALDVLLRANFNNTLDVRYAIADKVVYAVFLHPISSLSPELIESALAQVLSLAKTFGSSFSASEPRMRETNPQPR